MLALRVGQFVLELVEKLVTGLEKLVTGKMCNQNANTLSEVTKLF